MSVANGNGNGNGHHPAAFHPPVKLIVLAWAALGWTELDQHQAAVALAMAVLEAAGIRATPLAGG
jgi:hypothetical protein